MREVYPYTLAWCRPTKHRAVLPIAAETLQLLRDRGTDVHHRRRVAAGKARLRGLERAGDRPRVGECRAEEEIAERGRLATPSAAGRRLARTRRGYDQRIVVGQCVDERP